MGVFFARGGPRKSYVRCVRRASAQQRICKSCNLFNIFVELMLHMTLAFGAEFSVGVRNTTLLIASLLRKSQCNMKSDIFIVRDWEQGQSLTIILRCFFEQRCLEFKSLFSNDFFILLVAKER